MRRAVIQEETTGCGIAAVGTVLGKRYAQMKAVANAQGIHAEDEALWSDTRYVRKLLLDAGVATSDPTDFSSWDRLPDLALLSIKHHEENGRKYWHWVVFQRVDDQAVVLDSAAYLTRNVRTDFDQMQPQWFIEIENA